MNSNINLKKNQANNYDITSIMAAVKKILE